MKNTIIALIIIILIGIGGWFLWQGATSETVEVPGDGSMTDDTSMPADGEEPDTMVEEYATQSVLGQSVEGRDITAYHFGTGDTEILLVGGIHGAYSPNTTELAEEAVNYFGSDDNIVPENVRVTVIPELNPDGAVRSDRTEGRFNANGVDLNRNFDCEWEAEGVWRSTTVSGGDAPFSEPESQAVRDYVESVNPAAVVVYYSAADGVYASSCNGSVATETAALMNTYADAAGYDAFDSFDFYEITGDMVNWLAKRGTPGISVLLSDHTSSEWEKNKAGIEAVIESYGR